MLIRLLPAAVLVAGLSAQAVLIHDNGTFETRPGFSNLDTVTFGHGTYGWACYLRGTTDYSMFDDFQVVSVMVVEDVEVYGYQTGGGSGASTITGCYLAFYDTDPSLGGPEMTGSPLITTDQFTVGSNPVSNAWSGVYRELNGNGATNRAIMAVRVKLAQPLVLTPGTYWLEYQFSGSLTSGPWAPPLCSQNQDTTGNGMQKNAAGSFTNPVFSGSGGAQGFPFKLYGQGAVPGSFVLAATNPGSSLGITVGGSANLADEGYIRTNLQNVTTGAIPVIGYDLGATPSTFCGHNFLHTFPFAVFLADTSVIDIPNDISLAGLVISVQGAELTPAPAPPGACLGAANISDGYTVTVQL